MEFYEISLSSSPTQLSISEWAVEGMEGIYGDVDEERELWGEDFEECPVMIEDRSLFIVDKEDVVRDFLYRIEVQYIQMAKDEGEREYKNSLRAVVPLSNKIRSLFGMEFIDWEDLAV